MPTMRTTPNMASQIISGGQPENYFEGQAARREENRGLNWKAAPDTVDKMAVIQLFVDTVGSAWKEQAACKGRTDIDFVPRYFLSTKNVAACKAVCAECPVKTECLQMALESNDKYGICGGLTPTERKAL